MSSTQQNFVSRSHRWLGVVLGLAFCAPLAAGHRIFQCEGPHGEMVFRDQPCSRAGLLKAGQRKLPVVRRSNSALSEHSACGFESDPLALADPALKDIKLRLVVEIDDDGPYLSIAASGQHFSSTGPAPALQEMPAVSAAAEPAAAVAGAPAAVPTQPVVAGLQPATFDFRVSTQGIQFVDGRFVESDWRMGAQTLGFGRSRMRSLLTALSQEPATVVVWFEGDAAPVSAATMPPEDFRLAVDNARRCWKTRAAPH